MSRLCLVQGSFSTCCEHFVFVNQSEILLLKAVVLALEFEVEMIHASFVFLCVRCM